MVARRTQTWSPSGTLPSMARWTAAKRAGAAALRARRASAAPPQRSASIRAAPGEPFGEAVRRLGVRNVLFSWTDLFGAMRSKMVPAATAADVAADGAGFAGFAAHLDLQPSDPDVLATPDVSSLVVLPWKREVAWVACDLTMGGKPLDQRCESPRSAPACSIPQACLRLSPPAPRAPSGCRRGS